MNIWRKKTQQASKLMLTSGPRALAPQNIWVTYLTDNPKEPLLPRFTL